MFCSAQYIIAQDEWSRERFVEKLCLVKMNLGKCLLETLSEIFKKIIFILPEVTYGEGEREIARERDSERKR